MFFYIIRRLVAVVAMLFVISISRDGFDPYSQQMWAKGNECSHLMPGLPGLPAEVSP